MSGDALREKAARASYDYASSREDAPRAWEELATREREWFRYRAGEIIAVMDAVALDAVEAGAS